MSNRGCMLVLAALAVRSARGWGADVPATPDTTPQQGEWTFEAAGECWTPMTKPIQHVGIPGCQWQAGVYYNGALLFGDLLHWKPPYLHPYRRAEDAALGNFLLHLTVGYGERMSVIDRAGTNSPLIKRNLIAGRLPIPQVHTTDGDLAWEQTVFAHLLDRQMEAGMTPRPSDMPVTHVLFKVINRGAATRHGRLWLHFGDLNAAGMPAMSPQLGKELNHTFAPPFGWFPEEYSGLEPRVRYVLKPPVKGGLVWHNELTDVVGVTGPARRVIEWDVPLAPGEEAELCLSIPMGVVERLQAERIARLDGQQVLERVRQFWKTLIDRGGRIETPDAFVNDYLAAVAGQMAQQVGYRHLRDIWMYKTSPNWYEDYYPACAARALPVFDLRGLEHISKPVLGSLVRWQSDDIGLLDRRRGGDMARLPGAGFERHPGLLGNFGNWTANCSIMGHGLALWALASHYRITRDREWLGDGAGSPMQAMLDGFDWVSVQRRRTMRDENGQKAANWGLLPPASAHDWLSGSAIFNDAWCIHGMAEIVRVLREIDHPQAEAASRELNEYRACLADRYREARDHARPLPLDGGKSIPFVPRLPTELDWKSIDWTYVAYGPLRAGALGALEPGDELVNQTLAFIEAGCPAAEPGGQRQCFAPHWVDVETHWPMYDVFLERDDLPRFFELCFNNLAATIHHDWRVGCEARDGVVSTAPGEAERWRMIRAMFVRECGGCGGTQQELFLLQALPRSWLRPGARLSVANMGTWFGGKLDLGVQVAADGDTVRVDAVLKLAESPANIRMRLRSGDGRPLVAATINGEAVPVQAGDVIMLPLRTTAHYRIVGEFRSR
jgi:hypothetical protein